MQKSLITTAVLFAILNLTGCALVMPGDGYHADHGDLVNSDGTFRYVGWCEVHRHNSHCRESQQQSVATSRPSIISTQAKAAVPQKTYR